MSLPQALLCFTTLPDAEAAAQLARELVEARLAACVNILPPCRSVYRWQDVVQNEAEVPMVIKTTTERYPALETYIRQKHPYKLPEIVAVQIAHGLPAYLDWLAAESAASVQANVSEADVKRSGPNQTQR